MDSTSPCFSFSGDKDIFDALTHKDEALVNKAMKCLDSYKVLFFNFILNRFTNGNIHFNRAEKLKDLEDVYQDTMLVFIRKVKSNDSPFKVGEKASIRTYIFACGVNIYKDKLRKLLSLQQKKKDYEEKLKNEVILNLLTNLQQEKAANVQQAIEEQKTDCRELLDLRYNEGLTPKEIAQLHNENANAVSQKLLRCRDKVKQLLILKYGFPDSFI